MSSRIVAVVEALKVVLHVLVGVHVQPVHGPLARFDAKLAEELPKRNLFRLIAVLGKVSG